MCVLRPDRVDLEEENEGGGGGVRGGRWVSERGEVEEGERERGEVEE